MPYEEFDLYQERLEEEARNILIEEKKEREKDNEGEHNDDNSTQSGKTTESES